jgi:hypothetical protein
MRRSIYLLAAALVTGTIGVTAAVADKGGSASTRSVAATFTATASDVKTNTCAGANGVSFRVTKATFNGTSTSAEGALNGPVRVKTRMVVNTATGDGVVSGSFRVRPAGNGGASARLTGVVSGNVALKGFLSGKARGGESTTGRKARGGKLLANFSANQAGTALTGELGAASLVARDSAIVMSGSCGENDGD